MRFPCTPSPPRHQIIQSKVESFTNLECMRACHASSMSMHEWCHSMLSKRSFPPPPSDMKFSSQMISHSRILTEQIYKLQVQYIFSCSVANVVRYATSFSRWRALVLMWFMRVVLDVRRVLNIESFLLKCLVSRGGGFALWGLAVLGLLPMCFIRGLLDFRRVLNIKVFY